MLCKKAGSTLAIHSQHDSSMHGMVSDVEINSVAQNSFWPKKMRENPVNSAFKMYSNISEAYSYNL